MQLQDVTMNLLHTILTILSIGKMLQAWIVEWCEWHPRHESVSRHAAASITQRVRGGVETATRQASGAVWAILRDSDSQYQRISTIYRVAVSSVANVGV